MFGAEFCCRGNGGEFRLCLTGRIHHAHKSACIKTIFHCHGQFIGLGDKVSESRSKVSRQCTGKLGGVIFERGELAVDGLALGVHRVIIAPALFSCILQCSRQEVVGHCHFLHFGSAFAGIIGQDAVDINASIGKLLDVCRRGFSCVFDLLEVLSHSAQLIAAAAHS